MGVSFSVRFAYLKSTGIFSHNLWMVILTLKRQIMYFPTWGWIKPTNKIRVKVNGGAIGILDNEDALHQCAVAGPQIAEILEGYL